MGDNPIVTDEVESTKKRTLPEALKPHLWKPGQSGNPHGLAGGPVAALMRDVRNATDNGEKVIQVLMAGLANSNWNVKLKAAEMLLERGWGKAPQPLAITGEKSGTVDLSKLSDEELKVLGLLIAKTTSQEPDIKDAEQPKK